MNGWVDAGSGEPVDNGLDPRMPEICAGLAELELGAVNTHILKSLQGPVEPLEEPVTSRDTPSLYEVRRDALMAASNLTSSGGWIGPGDKTLEFAEKFEKYLLEVREK